MRNIWTIARRELKLYFISPIAYLVAFAILLTVGVIFGLNILQASQPSYYGAYVPDAQIVTGPIAFLFVLSLPALTMRLLADEQRTGTLELLLTAPVRDAELVLGKWLGAFLFVLIILLVSLIYPLALNLIVDPGIDQGLMVSSYLGVILIAASFLAIGVGFSAIFSNQLAAFFATLVTFMLLWWLIGFPADLLPVGGELFRYLDMQSHFYDTLYRGIITLSDIIYFLSLTALGLFAGTTAVETRRWR